MKTTVFGQGAICIEDGCSPFFYTALMTCTIFNPLCFASSGEGEGNVKMLNAIFSDVGQCYEKNEIFYCFVFFLGTCPTDC